MTTINISLPAKLKLQADQLVKTGFYVSFSDLMRDALRKIIDKNQYETWLDEAKADEKKGEAIVLSSKKDINNYFENL